MNIYTRIIVTVFLTLSFALVASPVEGELDVYIRVYKIPRIQYWSMELPGDNGETTSIRVDGDLTAVFPDGVVFLQTDLSPVASNSAITQVIKDRIFFGGNNFKATRVRVEDLKKVHLRFDESHSFEEVEFDKEISSSYEEKYRIQADVKSMEEDEIIMKVSFDSGWSSSGGRLGVSMGGTIFDRTIVLPEHKILLIGFPSYDKGPRGTVFWLAISVIRKELAKTEK